MDLLDSVRRVCHDVKREIPNINSGGCGIFASELGRALERQGKKAWARAGVDNFHRTVYGDVLNSAAVVRRLVNSDVESRYDPYTWEDNGFMFNHVIVRFKHEGKVWQADADGGLTPAQDSVDNYWTLEKGALSLHEVEQFVKVKGFWNRRFNRHTGTPIVKRIVREHLEKSS